MCSVCDSKKSILIKQQEASGLLSNLGLKTPLSKKYKTNEIANKFLLSGDNFMSEMHRRQTRFYTECLYTIYLKKERIQKFKETGDSRYI